MARESPNRGRSAQTPTSADAAADGIERLAPALAAMKGSMRTTRSSPTAPEEEDSSAGSEPEAGSLASADDELQARMRAQTLVAAIRWETRYGLVVGGRVPCMVSEASKVTVQRRNRRCNGA